MHSSACFLAMYKLVAGNWQAVSFLSFFPHRIYPVQGILFQKVAPKVIRLKNKNTL